MCCVAFVVLFQVKEYTPPPPEQADVPSSDKGLNQLKAEGQAKQQALEQWCRTAYGEVSHLISLLIDTVEV